jgi:orotate phosphoribosyltransferase
VLKAVAAKPIAAAMNDDEVLREFREADALLEGHFILSSGLRSPRYLQCARVLMDPARAERIARALAEKLPAGIREEIDQAGGKVIAAASIVDRSGGSADLGVPYTGLIRIDVPTYEADALPPELAAIPPMKPGSRAAA